MKLLILGATGRTGQLILEEALKQEYDVTCLVRDPKKIKVDHGNLEVIKGSPEEIADLDNAVKGCEGIISALNVSRMSDFPWSKLRTPPRLMSDVMKNILALNEKNDFKRMIICSAWGVSETKKDIPSWFRWLIENSNIGLAYEDHERQENELKKSKLNWTIVRPSGLTNSKKEKKVIESYNNIPKPKLTISRKNVAKFMVDALQRDNLIGLLPVISA